MLVGVFLDGSNTGASLGGKRCSLEASIANRIYNMLPSRYYIYSMLTPLLVSRV